MYKKLILLICCATFLSSCFKTAEEIRREENVDQQLKQSSQTITELRETIQNLKTQISQTSGQLEEIDYKQKEANQEKEKSITQNLTQITEQMKILLDDNEKLKKQVSKLQKDVDAQKKYIKSVNSTLVKVAGPNKASTQSKLQQAHKAFEKNKKKTAFNLYQEVLSEGKISNAQKNHVYYNLGLLQYWKGQFDDSITYFSKIYTKYPKSSFSPRALLYIARSFGKQKKKDEANAMYQELINKYPKSRHAKTAKKEMK